MVYGEFGKYICRQCAINKVVNIDASSKLIYCLGDSHVNFFSGNNIMQNDWPMRHVDRVPIFRTYKLGAHLAYGLAKKNSLSKKKLFKVLTTIPKDSNIILCYGEIDCRVHLIRQSEIQKRNLTAVVNECVDRYFSVIKEIRDMGYKIIVYHLIPSTAFNIIRPGFPTYGSPMQRNKATTIFNKRLAYWAKKYHFPQISLFNQLLLPSGSTNMKYYSDPIHLSTSALPTILAEIDSHVPGIDKKLLWKKYKINYLEYLYFCVLRKTLLSLLLILEWKFHKG